MPFKRATNCANAPSTENIIHRYTLLVNYFFSKKSVVRIRPSLIFADEYDILYLHPIKGADSMTRFIEESKLSKRARKELNAARRKTWDVNPISRKVESKKLYNRKRKPCSRYEDSAGLLFMQF